MQPRTTAVKTSLANGKTRFYLGATRIRQVLQAVNARGASSKLFGMTEFQIGSQRESTEIVSQVYSDRNLSRAPVLKLIDWLEIDAQGRGCKSMPDGRRDVQILVRP
jgi:hypothetical protein